MPEDGIRPASLRRGDEFQAVYRSGSRYVSSTAIIYVLPRPDRVMRVGVPVGRKLGTSVVRNRIRRRIREAFKRAASRSRGGADVILLPRALSASAPFEAIISEIRSALVSSGVIYGSDMGGTPRETPQVG